ncbi:MAG TPA: GDYXXLXY domain-containing protein [Chthoniobacterales bacterium]
MKNWRGLLFALVAFAQAAVPASMIWKREATLRHGRVWKFRTEPVDPVDAFRGRYIALNFEAEREEIPKFGNLKRGHSVYVALKENAEGFAEIDQISPSPLKGDNMIEAKVGWRRLSLPFDKYWVTERDAPAAEAAYRAQSARDKKNAYATVRVFNGDAAIEQLYLDGLPLGEYLRAHSPK